MKHTRSSPRPFPTRPRACLRDSRARYPPPLGWVKALSTVIGVVALVRIGVHILRQQGDGVPDRDDTFDKLVNWVIGIFLGAGAVAILAALGLSVTASC